MSEQEEKEIRFMIGNALRQQRAKSIGVTENPQTARALDVIEKALRKIQQGQLQKEPVLSRKVWDGATRSQSEKSLEIDFTNRGEVLFLVNVVSILKNSFRDSNTNLRMNHFLDYLVQLPSYE